MFAYNTALEIRRIEPVLFAYRFLDRLAYLKINTSDKKTS